LERKGFEAKKGSFKRIINASQKQPQIAQPKISYPMPSKATNKKKAHWRRAIRSAQQTDRPPPQSPTY
jgi:hypothetical protein